MIRVLVIDDSAVMRRLIRDALGRDARIEVVGDASDGREAIDRCSELRPDVLTLDLSMPNTTGLDVLAGADDVVLELAIAGARGWICGYANAFPRECVALLRAGAAGDLATALPLYRRLHPLLRWDSRTEFVQAIKLSMDLAGRYGGPCRPPRCARSRPPGRGRRRSAAQRRRGHRHHRP